MAVAEFRLPSEFLSDDLFFDTDDNKPTKDSTPVDSSPSESDEEDHLAGLTRRMAHSFLFDTDTNDHPSRHYAVKPAATSGTSPQSTLCDYGIWSGSSVASQSSSPPTTPSDHRKDDDAWDLLAAAAGQVVRLSETKEQSMTINKSRGLLGTPAAAPPFPVPEKGNAGSKNGSCSNPQPQKQFHRVPQQTWGRGGGGEGWCGGRAPLGLPSSAWPPLQKQQQHQQRDLPQQRQPGSGMRAVFITGSGAARRSAGTGVFLPRRPGTLSDHCSKKPACSTVLLPDRVIQALNLNLDDLGSHPRFPGGYILDHDALVARGKQTQYRPPPSTASAANDLRLPAEWTY